MSYIHIYNERFIIINYLLFVKKYNNYNSTTQFSLLEDVHVFPSPINCLAEQILHFYGNWQCLTRIYE